MRGSNSCCMVNLSLCSARDNGGLCLLAPSMGTGHSSSLSLPEGTQEEEWSGPGNPDAATTSDVRVRTSLSMDSWACCLGTKLSIALTCSSASDDYVRMILSLCLRALFLCTFFGKTCCFRDCPIAQNFSPTVWSSFSRKSEMTIKCTDESMRRRMRIARSSVFCGVLCFRRAWLQSLSREVSMHEGSNGRAILIQASR